MEIALYRIYELFFVKLTLLLPSLVFYVNHMQV